MLQGTTLKLTLKCAFLSAVTKDPRATQVVSLACKTHSGAEMTQQKSKNMTTKDNGTCTGALPRFILFVRTRSQDVASETPWLESFHTTDAKQISAQCNESPIHLLIKNRKTDAVGARVPNLYCRG